MIALANRWSAQWANPRVRAGIRVAWAAFVTLCAITTVALAILYGVQQATERDHRHKEAVTVKLACERSREFGPPFVLSLELTERERVVPVHPLEEPLPIRIHGKRVSVLDFYKSTIPPSCPK